MALPIELAVAHLQVKLLRVPSDLFEDSSAFCRVSLGEICDTQLRLSPGALALPTGSPPRALFVEIVISKLLIPI